MAQETNAQFIQRLVREHIERMGVEYVEALEAVARASFALAENSAIDAIPEGKELKSQLQAFLQLEGMKRGHFTNVTMKEDSGELESAPHKH